MHRHQLGPAAVAVVAMAVLSASAPPASGDLAPWGQRPPASPGQLVETGPALIAFDDLAPAEAVARFGARTAISAASGTAKPKLPRPPRTGAAGSAPPAGSPQAVLAAAYRRAVSRAARGCHLQVAHLAAIGQVESGSIGGRSVTADHRVTPAIYGPLLDGGPFAVVHDSDGGAIDGASDYDRAVGPLQFLPGSWSWAGRDGDGDGRRDPQNVFDAALAAADYLCRGGRDLARARDLRSAVLSYNQSGAYHSAVLEWVSYFQRHGLAALVTVAFRVGSGGRASALTVATPDPSPPTSAPGATAAKPASTGSSPSTGSAGPATPTSTSTVPPAATPTPPAPADQPSPHPTTPAPSPTPTTPEPADPGPADPEPTPTPTEGDGTR